MKYLGVPQSGSQSNTTASRNRYGQYYRNRAIPVNPASIKQGLARGRLATFSSRWKDLSNADRTAWEDCAAENPIVNTLGQTVILSGLAMYVRANTALSAAGAAFIDTPGVATMFSTNGITFTAAAGTPAMSVVFTPPVAGQFLVIDMSQQVSVGVSFMKDYRFMIAQDSADTSPVSVLALYTAQFGSLIEGKKIFARARVINECGVYSPAAYATAVVAA